MHIPVPAGIILFLPPRAPPVDLQPPGWDWELLNFCTSAVRAQVLHDSCSLAQIKQVIGVDKLSLRS